MRGRLRSRVGFYLASHRQRPALRRIHDASVHGADPGHQERRERVRQHYIPRRQRRAGFGFFRQLFKQHVRAGADAVEGALQPAEEIVFERERGGVDDVEAGVV